MLSVEQVLTEKFPGFFVHKPRLVTRPVIMLLRMLFHEKEINRFLADNSGLRGLDFIEKVLEYFSLDYSVSNKELENIPASGRLVIVANHPLGALDALALILMVSRVRRDIRVVANDLLMSLSPLQEMLLPVDNLREGATKAAIKKIHAALQQEQVVIVFPAGEVSRLRLNGIRDTYWKQGFLKFARRTSAPILPVFIDARNSPIFYSVSMLAKPLAALLLVQEMFNQRHNTLGFKIGELIPYSSIAGSGLRAKGQVRMLRKHLYRVARGKGGYFATERSIAHPESRQELKRELSRGELLGQTTDGKQIILMDWSPQASFVREIGRLRELSFRKVGEGTGHRRDTDGYDQYYSHLVLWDDDDLEIAGAYRFGDGASIVDSRGTDGLYTSTLFSFSGKFSQYASRGLELGRSFVQPRYWGSRALDYLWQGLGAYLRHRPEIRYLFGPVSISAAYPRPARDILIYFYQHYFGDQENCAFAKTPYRISDHSLEECRRLFGGGEFKRDLQELKHQLSLFNLTIPTLYKQYTDLCEEGGVRFLDFNVDPMFAGCTDGLILVDLSRVKQVKRKRYIGE